MVSILVFQTKGVSSNLTTGSRHYFKGIKTV